MLTYQYLFVVDTRQYSGNFERQMCAFITGIVGDCGVGDKEARDALFTLSQEQREWFEDNIAQVEEEGCARPCAIYPTPYRANNGAGRHFDIPSEHHEPKIEATAYESVVIYLEKKPSKEMYTLMDARAIVYCLENNLTYMGVRLFKVSTRRVVRQSIQEETY